MRMDIGGSFLLRPMGRKTQKNSMFRSLFWAPGGGGGGRERARAGEREQERGRGRERPEVFMVCEAYVKWGSERLVFSQQFPLLTLIKKCQHTDDQVMQTVDKTCKKKNKQKMKMHYNDAVDVNYNHFLIVPDWSSSFISIRIHTFISILGHIIYHVVSLALFVVNHFQSIASFVCVSFPISNEVIILCLCSPIL